jgi:predicted Zn-dependent protease
MATKTEKDLNESLRNLWLKAVAAIEQRNFDYAISLLRGILKQEPEFLTGRQLLRRAEVAKDKTRKKGFFHLPTSTLWIIKAQRELKRDPRRAVEMIEEILEREPRNRQANLVLKEAALAAGWPEIAVFALQTLLEENGRDTKVLHELGRLYHDLGKSEKEVEVYNRIIEIDPANIEADRLGKDASASASIKSGGWAQADSYRDLIKKEESGT